MADAAATVVAVGSEIASGVVPDAVVAVRHCTGSVGSTGTDAVGEPAGAPEGGGSAGPVGAGHGDCCDGYDGTTNSLDSARSPPGYVAHW